MAEDIDSMSMEELERRIRELPPGYLSIKTIRGKERYYHQWYADGRQHTEYVRAEDFPDLKEKGKLCIMSLTDGATPQDTRIIPFKRIMRPMYPIDEI